jgi:hypothetical protein
MLPRIPEGMETIGMNASLSHYQSRYWVGLDLSTLWAARKEGYEPDYTFLPNTPGYDFGNKVEIKTIYGRRFSWSQDLTKYIYPCRATIWYCLQLAAFMGFDPIFVTGFDLKGPRPKGHVNAGHTMEPAGIHHQLQLMGYLRRLLETKAVTARIFNCSTEINKDDWSPIGYPLHAEDEGRYEDLSSKEEELVRVPVGNADDQVVDGFGEKPL